MNTETTQPLVKYTDRPRPKVFIPIPAYDWKTEVHFQASLMAAYHGCHAEIKHTWGMGDGVARTRNNQAWHFLTQTDAEYFFPIDSDIVFDPVQLDRIVSHGLPICGGLYPKKQGMLSWVVSSLPGETAALDTHLLKVRETGTGFLCIRRDVLEAMVKRFPEIAYRGDPDPNATRWDFFPMHAHHGRYLSEDWFFCARARECGFDVMVDISVQVNHVGKIIYPLQKTLTDDEVVDLVEYRTAHSKEQIRAFMGCDVSRDLRAGEQSLWPEEYAARGIAQNHCADVLAGCYDVPVEAASVLDIGANIGAFARWASARWPKATLTCYEPHPDNFDLLKSTIDRIKRTDAVLVNKAVVHTTQASGAGETLNLRIGRNNCGEHSLMDTGEQTMQSVPVQFICANELPAADVLKLDTEGCEYLILGTLAALSRLRDYKAVVLEYHREDDREGIRRLLRPTHKLHAVVSYRPDRGLLKFIRNEL